MPLVTTNKMLQKAMKEAYAVGAFNVENMEMVKAVISAAEEMKSPVILQTTPSTLRYISPKSFVSMVKSIVEEAEESTVDIALHLDHGSSYELALQCLHAGYTSIMIDASQSVLAENIEKSAQVVEACKSCNIPVEAELGKVGGKEDDTQSSENIYTDSKEAKTFVENTNVSSLAIAIGTAHGFYKGTPKLDIQRLKEIREVVSIPLVLHGASGVPDELVQEAIASGISKVNFATELRVAYSDGVKETLNNDASVFDPKVYGKAGIEKVKTLVKRKIEVCGSHNKA